MPKKIKLPPDPEDMNDDRSQWAKAAIEVFRAQTRCDHGDAVCDLIADLGHYCDRHGLDFPSQLRRGVMHYEEETERETAIMP